LRRTGQSRTIWQHRVVRALRARRRARANRVVGVFMVITGIAGLATAVVVRSPETARAAVNSGYWLVGTDGGIFPFGQAGFHGSMGGKPLNRPIVGMAATRSGRGYWLVAEDGGIFAFGDATFHGSTGGIKLNRPIVGMTPTPSGRGYWLVAADGGIFAFGDAGFFGSMGGKKLNRPIVDMASTPSGRGYWMVARDGGIFAFGDAGFHGSTGGIELASRIHAMAPTPTGRGYWMVAGDGGIFAFGDAGFYGSAAQANLDKRVVDIAASPIGRGYHIVTSHGAVYAFGDARYHGGTHEIPLNNRIAAMTSVAANDPPVVVDDVLEVDEDTSGVIDVLGNDRDPEGGGLSLGGVVRSPQGDAVIVSGRSVSYVPAPDFHGSDVFTYTVVDDAGATATGRVAVTVTPKDDSPKAVDDAVSLPEDGGVPVRVDVLGNDSGLGDGLKAVNAGKPEHGTVTVGPDHVSYRPNPDFSGSDSFGYSVVDADGDTSSAKVQVTVLPQDDVPTARDDTASVSGGKTISIDAVENDDLHGEGFGRIEFIGPAGGPVGDGFIATELGGKAERTGDGEIRYRPPQNVVPGSRDHFRYVLWDRDDSPDMSSPALVTMLIGENKMPTADSDTLQTQEGQPVSDAVSGSDEEGSVTFDIVGGPTNGALSPDPAFATNGRFTYTPNPGFLGTDAFEFSVTDESGLTDTARVEIEVDPAPPPPPQQMAGVSGGVGWTVAGLAPVVLRRLRRRR
jgi:hypothetical protein